MSIKRTQHWLSQQRVDVSHLRGMESAVANDFDDLIKGAFTGANPYIIRGFNLIHSIGIVASDLQVSVADGALFHTTAAEAGSILTVPVGTSNEILNSSNSKVSGSFTAGSTNYIALDYTKEADDSTTDAVAFFSPDTNREFTRQVPLARTMNYKFVISSTGFGTLLPVAKVVTDSSNAITEITDCRPLLFRLGSGGTTPNPFFVYPFPDGPTVSGSGRSETSSTSTGATSPFEGGDKEIKNFKNWSDAVMTILLELSGGAFWYSAGSISGGSIKKLRMDAINFLVTGHGRFIHSSVTPGLFSWTSDLEFKFMAGKLSFKVPAGSVNIAEDQVAYIDLVRDVLISPAKLQFSNSLATVTSTTSWTAGVVIGDWIKNIVDEDQHYAKITGIVDAFTVNIDTSDPSNFYTGTPSVNADAVRFKGSYSVLVADREDTTPDRNNPDMYWIAYRQPTTTSATITTLARTSNIVTVTTSAAHGFAIGQSIAITGTTLLTGTASFNITTEIASVPAANQLTFAQSAADGTASGGTADPRPKIYVRFGQSELEQGESAQIGDPSSDDDVRTYIGMSSEIDTPNYIVSDSNAKTGQENYSAVSGEDLTARISRLSTQMGDKAQDKNVRLREGGDISWTVVSPANTLSWTAPFAVQIPGSTNNNSIAIGSITLLAGQAAYFTINRNAALALTLTVVAEALVPVNENSYVFAHRGADDRVFMMDGTSYGDGQTGKLGSDVGGSGNQEADFDRHEDLLIQNDFQEIFIDVLDDQANLNATNTINTTFSNANKSITANTDATLVTYDPSFPATTPDAATPAWTTTGDNTLDSIVSSKLRINDTSGATQLYYSRTEAGLTAKVQADIECVFNVASATTAAPADFTGLFWRMSDGTKEFGAIVTKTAGVTYIGLGDSSGFYNSGTEFVATIDHTMRLVKNGDHSACLFLDDVLIDVVAYADLVPSATTTIQFGTLIASPTIDVTFTKLAYSIYQSVIETNEFIRRTPTVFLPMNVEPNAATPAWTKGSSGGSTGDVTTEPGKLFLQDISGAGGIYYELSGVNSGLSVNGRRKTITMESRVHLRNWTASHGALNEFNFIAIDDNQKLIIVALCYDGTNSSIALSTTYGFGAAVAGTSVVTLTGSDAWDYKPQAIRVVKTADEKVDVYVNRELVISANYSSLPNSVGPRIQFGSSLTLHNQIANTMWDDVYISLGGELEPVELNVMEFLPTVSTSDFAPSIWFSSDNGLSWVPADNGEPGGYPDTTIYGGGELLTRIALSKSGSVVSDYSIMYSRDLFTQEGFYKYYEFTAGGGETSIALPFSYAVGNKEIEVIEDGLELFQTVDYIEADPTTITLTNAALAGSRYKIRVNHRIVGGSTSGGGGGGSGRRQIYDINGGSNPPSSGAIGATFFRALKFSVTIDEDIYFQFAVPDNCDITQPISLVATYSMSTSNAGAVKLTLNQVPVNLTGDSLTVAASSSTLTITPGVGADVKRSNSGFLINVTDNSAIVGCQLLRNGSDGADTHTGTFDLLTLEINYTVV